MLFPSPGHPCGPPDSVFSTEIQDQGCHPRYLQRFRRSLSTSTFPARSSPAWTSQPAFRPVARFPKGLSFGPTQHLTFYSRCATQAFEVSLAFSLDPAPYGFRFGVRAIPAVMNPRFLPGCFASRIDPPSASPLLPRSFRARRSPSPLAGFRLRSRGPTVFPLGSCRRLFYVRRSPAGSSRFLPTGHPATSSRLFGTHCLRRVLPLTFEISRNPAIGCKPASSFRQEL